MDNFAAVLDTFALLAYIKGETGSKLVGSVIDKSIMSVIKVSQ